MIDEGEAAGQGRRTLGVIDGTLTQLALASVALLPTALAVVLWPRVLAPMVAEIEPEGRRGIFLAPGSFFVIGTLTTLIIAAIFLQESGGALVRMGTGVSSAASEGQVWKVASLIFPLFAGSVVLGFSSYLLGRLTGVAGWPLTAAVRSGFYALFGLGAALIALEPLSNLFGDGGPNHVFEPAVVAGGGLYASYFYLHIMTRGGARRNLAALLVGVAAAALVWISYGAPGLLS
jgi:hypothetical protein